MGVFHTREGNISTRFGASGIMNSSRAGEERMAPSITAKYTDQVSYNEHIYSPTTW